MNRLNDLIVENEEAKLLDKAGFKSSALTLREEFTSIEVKELVFGYTNLEQPILRNINFSLTEGQKLVITGPSGCGKTNANTNYFRYDFTD